MSYYNKIIDFINKADNNGLGTKVIKNDYLDTDVSASYGSGVSAHIPTLSFLISPNETNNGIYPVYLYYKQNDFVILAYGISVKNKPKIGWNIVTPQTIDAYFNQNNLQKKIKYGNSFVFKVYKTDYLKNPINKETIDNDLENIITHYKTSLNSNLIDSNISNADQTASIAKDNSSHPLNTILYGPPGTGKTYNTVNKALEIIDPEFFQSNVKNRAELNRRFKELRYNPKSKEGQIAFVTFHQSMSYEDFIEGIKPLEPVSNQPMQYDIVDGLFKSISNKASEKLNFATFDEIYEIFINDIRQKDTFSLNTPIQNKTFDILINSNDSCIAKPRTETATEMVITKKMILDYLVDGTIRDWKPYLTSIADYIKEKYEFKIDEVDNRTKPYVLIIDEINRGNVSQIFGELITLIEEDKRKGEKEEIEVILPYSKERFSVPSNLYIIGTMNTADRSVEALDTALRRRFSFIVMNPEPEILNKVGYKCEGIDLEKMLIAINSRIEKLLDKDYCIGHSYFMSITDKLNPLVELQEIFQNKVLPLLQEYFYGDWGKIQLIIGEGFVEVKNETIKFLKNNDYYDEYENKIVYKFTKPESWDLKTFESIYEQV